MIRPSVTANFENCLARHRAVVETKRLLGEDGLLVSLNAISEVIKSLDKTFLVGAETWVSRIFNTNEARGGSIDGTRAISFQKSKNGDGGVEVGLVLEKRYMEAFASLFAEGFEEKLSRM
ncbi:phenolic glucoside malonyltransferase 2-like [Pyrus ussuriensis x Pyrus communis]|uniref:Phenolic glucoside malonyltransferase 2-like n=1 Tax=Pyrus ussuriensis x Pyrus communis TaxID=2448454 RepID=A0A5N5H4N1_9ROSA|nr:phenolic glucoside malonyltransferase 2-like [Pyrus ussuriensis x Pyrus communis]